MHFKLTLRRPTSRTPVQRARLRLESLEGRTLPSGTTSGGLPVADVGSAQTILSAVQRAAFHLPIFPDGTLGVVRSGDGGYVFFAAGNPGQQGTQRLTAGALGPSFGPALTPRDVNTFGMPLSVLRPDPHGHFDRDYAGGGPTYRITASDGRTALLQVYHGEFRYTGTRFYASLGMAISRDNGLSFQRIGEFIQPARTAGEAAAKGSSQDVGSGPLVEADQFGRPVTSSTNPNDIYYYTIFHDTDPTLSRPYSSAGSFALARAKKSDVIAAAFQGTVAHWEKFYQGNDSSPRPGVNYFTQPGLGGHFTPILQGDAGGYITFPSFAYDEYLGRFVLAYMYNNREILLRVSSGDLLHWGAPQIVASPAGARADALYPTLVGEGSDPARLGQKFWVYSVEGSYFPDWRQQALVAREVSFSLLPGAPPVGPTTAKVAASDASGLSFAQLIDRASAPFSGATGADATRTVVRSAGPLTHDNLVNIHAASEAGQAQGVATQNSGSEAADNFLLDTRGPSIVVALMVSSDQFDSGLSFANNGSSLDLDTFSSGGILGNVDGRASEKRITLGQGVAQVPTSIIGAPLDLARNPATAQEPPAVYFTSLFPPLLSYLGFQVTPSPAPEPYDLPLVAIWDSAEHKAARVIDYAWAARMLLAELDAFSENAFTLKQGGP